MITRPRVTVRNRAEARFLQMGLRDPEVLAIAIVTGALAPMSKAKASAVLNLVQVYLAESPPSLTKETT